MQNHCTINIPSTRPRAGQQLLQPGQQLICTCMAPISPRGALTQAQHRARITQVAAGIEATTSHIEEPRLE